MRHVQLFVVGIEVRLVLFVERNSFIFMLRMVFWPADGR